MIKLRKNICLLFYFLMLHFAYFLRRENNWTLHYYICFGQLSSALFALKIDFSSFYVRQESWKVKLQNPRRLALYSRLAAKIDMIEIKKSAAAAAHNKSFSPSCAFGSLDNTMWTSRVNQHKIAKYLRDFNASSTHVCVRMPSLSINTKLTLISDKNLLKGNVNTIFSHFKVIFSYKVWVFF